MKALELINVLRDIAPEHLAEKWDKVGLQVGRYEQNVRRALLCIDLTEPVLDEAIKKKCQMIVAYHPPIFKPVERLVAGPKDERVNGNGGYTPSNWKQTLLVRLIEAGIAVYSPHTALDAVRGGMNDWLCDGLGKEKVRFSIGQNVKKSGLHKVVVFTPIDAADKVRQAMSDAGAGYIGKYDECSFNARGFGTFRAQPGAKPAIGKVGKLGTVEELRMEMVCYPDQIGAIVRAIRESHPYEEPAIDVFELAADREPEDEEQGAGRIHHLKTPITPKTLIRRLKSRLRLSAVKVALPAQIGADLGGREKPSGKISQIAVCVGAGGSLFESYPTCDAYITGEMQHHQMLDLQQSGAVVILAGHTNTERPFLPAYRDMISDRLPSRARKSLQIEVSEADKAPMSQA